MIEACVTTVSEDDDRTPSGWHKIEAYAVYVSDNGRIAVLGTPPEEPANPTDEWYANGHSCDEMGCGSLDHTVVHGRIERPWVLRTPTTDPGEEARDED